MQEVERIANTAGGFVSGSSLSVINPGSDEEERRQTGIVTIRVPSEAYASVMNQLRAIAEEIVAESSDTSEVTEEYTDLESRLRTLEATEARYLELLTRAETIEEILMLEDRLRSVRLEIDQVVGRINLLDNLSDLATITVRLDLPPVAAEAVVETASWAEEAWNEAWATSEDALKVVGTIGIVAGVTLIWLAIPAALVLAGWRLFGQKRTDKGTA
jgi:vacuolar-type H+-ATPase subunit I/STV1